MLVCVLKRSQRNIRGFLRTYEEPRNIRGFLRTYEEPRNIRGFLRTYKEPRNIRGFLITHTGFFRTDSRSLLLLLLCFIGRDEEEFTGVYTVPVFLSFQIIGHVTKLQGTTFPLEFHIF